MKKCSKCGLEKPLNEFYSAKGGRDGLRRDCKACFAARHAAWYEQDKAKEIARVKQWQQENAERLNAYRRIRPNDPEVKQRERSGRLKRKFGITQDQYEEMLATQGGGCAICSDPPEEGKALHVDHNHETGEVRALLCVRCNNGLGQFQEDPVLLDKARSYLDLAEDAEAGELAQLARARVRRLVAAH